MRVEPVPRIRRCIWRDWFEAGHCAAIKICEEVSLFYVPNRGTPTLCWYRHERSSSGLATYAPSMRAVGPRVIEFDSWRVWFNTVGVSSKVGCWSWLFFCNYNNGRMRPNTEMWFPHTQLPRQLWPALEPFLIHHVFTTPKHHGLNELFKSVPELMKSLLWRQTARCFQFTFLRHRDLCSTAAERYHFRKQKYNHRIFLHERWLSSTEKCEKQRCVSGGKHCLWVLFL